MSPSFKNELSFALKVVERAGKVALRYFHDGVATEMKSDNTPVTVADKEVEEIIRMAIATEFPDDEILGEESCSGLPMPGSRASHGRRWIVDPIDGTYNFARGVPIFSTMLALEVDGDIKLGIIHNPVGDGDTFWAEIGAGAYKNGSQLHVSKISSLEESQFNFGSPKRILSRGLWNGFTKLVSNTYRQRGFGDYLSFAHLLEGKAELALEVGLKPWDLAAVKIIAQESGGRYYDLNGGESIYTGDCLITNGSLDDLPLKVLLET
ncbi:MAG: hypothetical protein K2X29_00840 [Candidatus Obscuribacterales bacterium]|nr:hypothetical protein [Candidatus Obscuribacterales bacterium]